MLVERGAVEPRQAVRVFRKVAGHPVENHADAVPVARVDERAEVVGRAEPAGRREEAGDLIAPRASNGCSITGISSMCVKPSSLDVRHELVRQLAPGQRSAALVGIAPPRSRVHLVDGHRHIERGAVRARAASRRRPATHGGRVARDRRGARRQFGRKRERIGLGERRTAVRMNLELVELRLRRDRG